MNRFFKLFLIIFIYILVVSSSSFATFNDINGHWAEEKINDFYKSGFAEGYGDGTFKPDNDITRAEFCKIINSYMNYEIEHSDEASDLLVSGENVNNVSDYGKVSGETLPWQISQMEIAFNKGYLQLGKADEKITREEAFVALSKVMVLSNVDYELTFEDVSEISIWAVPAIKSLASEKHINGYNNKIMPKQNLKRCELVSILYDFVGVGGVDEEIENPNFEVGILKHNEYGLAFEKIGETLEVKSGESITFAVTLEESESEPKVEIISGKEFVEFDEENLILNVTNKGEVLINFTTDKHTKDIKVLIK